MSGYSPRGFRHAFHRNKQYPPRHADILLPPTGDRYRHAKAFFTLLIHLWKKFLPKFREVDNAKTHSLCLQAMAQLHEIAHIVAKLIIKMIVCKLMLAKKCIVKPKSVIRPTMVSLDVFLCHNSFIFAFCFKFCLDIARYVFNKIFTTCLK